MELDVCGHVGVLSHVSAGSLLMVAGQQRMSIALSRARADVTIAPCEFLAFHVSLNGALGGNL